MREADIARGLGYHAGMLSLAAMKGASVDELVAHCAAVAEQIPLVGFYLQTAVGGIALPADFWRRFAAIDNVIAIKMAPFDRYRTLDVVRGVVAAGAEERVTLYTGNDDHIVLDLLAALRGAARRRRGHACASAAGCSATGACGRSARSSSSSASMRPSTSGRVDADLLALDSRVTDCNSAFFDVAHGFAGCIPGCHEVLRRQGLLKGIWCLDPNETLSPGQAAEIDRVYREHADLCDDAFVAQNLARWLD